MSHFDGKQLEAKVCATNASAVPVQRDTGTEFLGSQSVAFL